MINLERLNPFYNRKDEWKVLSPLVGETICELGNKKNGDRIYKKYFEALGFKHVSIDWNGKDGALPLDLRKPIDMEPFDMVTNIGTTEHVSNQGAVWKNIHNLTKVGGIVVSVTPKEGNWWWHGEWYPREEFFKEFCKNGYEIEDMFFSLKEPHTNLYVRMKKIDHLPFVMPSGDTMFFNEMRAR